MIPNSRTLTVPFAVILFTRVSATATDPDFTAANQP
jgi:hypothetical protein